MPILHTINEDLGITLSSLVGAISDEELLLSYKTLYENPKWKPGFHEIVDMRNADMQGVTGNGLRQLASMVESYTSGKCNDFKTAIIAPEDLPFGLARMYQAFAEESPECVLVSRDLDAAFEWLGISESLLP